MENEYCAEKRKRTKRLQSAQPPPPRRNQILKGITENTEAALA